MGYKGGFRVTAEMLNSSHTPHMEEQNSFMNPTSYPVWCQQIPENSTKCPFTHPGTPDYTYPGGLRIKRNQQLR